MNSKIACGAVLCFMIGPAAACDGVSATSNSRESSSVDQSPAAANTRGATELARAEKPASGDRTARTSGPRPAGAAEQTRCVEVCQLADSLGCPAQPTCLTSCEEMRVEASRCAGHVDAFLACLARRTPSDFECGDEGLPSIKEAICESEQASLAHCLMGSH
jgi:hypothetical protein